MADMEPWGRGPVVAVLGGVQVVRWNGAGPVADAVSQTQARLLARLAVDPTEVTFADLTHAVWGPVPPRTSRAALSNQVSRLRSRFGEQVVATTTRGYRLEVATDVAVVADLVAQAEAAADPRTARALADEALGWRRGEPYADLRDTDFPEPAARYAAELLTAAETLRLSATLDVGGSAAAVAEAERLVEAAPYDERRWSLLARALDLAGRRGDALAVLGRARGALREHLGLDPGPLLVETDARLRHQGQDPRPRSRTGFVGREDVVGELLAAVTEGRRVLMTGEDGIGLSTVLLALGRALRARGHTVADAACTASAHVPLAELLTLTEQLAGGAPTPLQSLTDAFVAETGRAARTRPLALLLDDLHLAGPSTVSALLRAADQPGVALVATARGPFAADAEDGWARVGVGPLDAAASAEVVRRHRAEHPSGADERPDDDWYHQMSGGNPAFLSVLLEAAPHDATSVAGSVGDVVRARTAVLDAATRAAVEVAAVAGSGVPAVVVHDLASPGGVDRAVAAGVLLLDAGDLRFRHGVVEHVHLRGVAPGRRVELHQAIGERLLALGQSAAAARHLLLAAELSPRGAVAAAAAAAEEASRLGAHLDAAQWYEQALQVARDALGALDAPPERAVQLAVAFGNELRLAGRPAHVEVLLEAFAAAVDLEAPALVADAAAAVLALGSTTEAGGPPHEQAERLLEQALTVVEEPEPRARIAAAGSLALSMVGRPERSRRLFDDAERDARSPAARRAVLPYAYMTLGTPEELPRRERLGRELFQLAEDAGDPEAEFEAHHLLFSSALQSGDGDAVRAHVRRMRALVDVVGDTGRRWSALYASAALAHLEDDLAEAEALTDDALTTFAPVSPSRAVAAYGGQLLALRWAQGRLGELVDTLDALCREQPELAAWRAAASLALVDTEPDRARQLAASVLGPAPRDFSWLPMVLVAGRSAALVGDATLAAAYVGELAPWTGAGCWQGTCSYGSVDTTLALLHRTLGEDGAARRHAARARRFAERLGAPVFTRDLDQLGL